LTPSADAVVLDAVSVAYGSHLALEDVSASVASGGSVALIGPNGAGKTTLIKAVLGLVPITRGRIEVLGGPPAAARGRIAYVPQADDLDEDFPITAEQVVLTGRYRRIGWLRRPGKADRRAAAEGLDRVGLADRGGERFGQLSGGQRQRVLLARAIAQEAEVLLLDEPFNGVDTPTTDLVLNVLGDLRRAGAAVVLSTHDLTVAHLACNHVCLLNRRQVAFGAMDDTLSANLLRETYGGAAVVLAGDSTIVTTG
jgi:manganese/iron transport system ATP-binding protein